MPNRLCFNLPPELRRDLVRFCRIHRRPMSDVLREAVKCYMRTEELRRLHRKLRPHVEAKGLITDNDFFRIVS